MTHLELRNELKQLPFGKRLPTAVYVYTEQSTDLGLQLNDLVSGLRGKFEIDDSFNVLKFRTDEFKISFLSSHIRDF